MIYSVGQILEQSLRIVATHEGGMALVYVVEDLETGKKAAAKTIREEFLSDPSMVARFRREMKIWVGLGAHPNVVRTYFVKDIQSHPFLFMEYMDGGSLFGLVKEPAPVAIDQALQIALAVAEGMDHVHSRITPEGLRGIIHRDLKPANILLNRNGEVKVADFGLARALNATLLTQSCDMLGTIHYASPEQILDSRAVDKRADIYAFGAILYHITCGIPPFEGKTWYDLINKIKTALPPEPNSLRAECPEFLSHLIMRCLAKRKEERFDNFGEIAAAVRGCAQSGNITKQPAREGVYELNTILNAAEREASKEGCAIVEPVHFLLALVLEQSDPLAAWLARKKIDKDHLATTISSLARSGHPNSGTTELKYKNSSRRVIGMANTLAEQDHMHSPLGRHVLAALLRETSIRSVLEKSLKQLHVQDMDLDSLSGDDVDIFDLMETGEA